MSEVLKLSELWRGKCAESASPWLKKQPQCSASPAFHRSQAQRNVLKIFFSEWTLCWLHLRFLTRGLLFAGIGLWKQWPARDVTNRLQYFLDNAQKRLVCPTCSQSLLAPSGSLLSVWSRSWTSEDMMLDPRSSSRGWTRNEEWKWRAGGRGGDAGGPFTASFSHHQHTSVYSCLSFVNVSQLTVFKCVMMHQARAFIVGKWALTGLDACDDQVNERVLRVVWLSAASAAAGSILSLDAALRIKRDLSLSFFLWRAARPQRSVSRYNTKPFSGKCTATLHV